MLEMDHQEVIQFLVLKPQLVAVVVAALALE
jgi:hypothetical protein